MQRKLLLIACIALTFTVIRCLPPSVDDGDFDVRATVSPIPANTTPPDMKGTASPTSAQNGDSGIEGTTSSIDVSGVPGGATLEAPASIEFAIAPVLAGSTIYEKAMFVKSDAQGKFKVELPPGTYWIGPKAKALDPFHYSPGSVVFSEMVVEVKAGTFLSVEVVVTGYAP